jgi:hypothetical protein
MAEKDQATHASGRRSAEGASSDTHRISHSRDRTVGEAGADPQELDTTPQKTPPRTEGDPSLGRQAPRDGKRS